jgi:predicted proteasome-type protease
VTYCLGIYLRDGLVFASDSRTNAGVDHVATFRKMSIFERAGERAMYLLGAGNLATTQAVVNQLFRSLGHDDSEINLYGVDNMFDATEMIGDVLRSVINRHGNHVKAAHADPSADFLFGGQISPVPHLLGWQLHRGDAGNAVSSDRRDEVRQADPRPRHRARSVALARGQGRVPVV